MSMRPFHHQRPLVALAFCYGLGIGAGVYFSLWKSVAILGLLLSLPLVWLLPKIRVRRIAAALCIALFLGMGYGGQKAHPTLPETGSYTVEAIVAQDVALRENGNAYSFLEQVHLRNAQGEQYLSRAYWTFVPDAETVLPLEGQRLQFTARLYQPPEQMNPYGGNFRLYLLQQGAVAGLTGNKEMTLLDAPGRGIRSFFYGLRRQGTALLAQLYGENAALPQALLLGVRDQLPEEMRQGFANAGIAHILSVSGLHVTLLGYALLWPFRKRQGLRGKTGLLGGFLLFYCALLDFSAPVVRASILMMLNLVRRSIRRAPDPLTALAAAFLLILLFRPLDLFSVGFQLSFLAVLGMIALLPHLERLTDRLNHPELVQGLNVSLAASAGVALPAVTTFHQLSVIGLLVSPLACGLSEVLLPAYALSLLAGMLWLPAGKALAWPLGYATNLFSKAAQWLGELPFAAVRLPTPPWFVVLAIAICACIATRFVALPRRKKAWVISGLLGVALVIWPFTVCRDVQYIQLAAGQADCALILDGDSTTLIDAGENGNDLASFLLSTGRRADTLVLTHLHSDHFGGVEALLDERISIGRVYLPSGAEKMEIDAAGQEILQRLREAGVPIFYLQAGDSFSTARCSFRVVWPAAEAAPEGGSANRYSLAMLCELDGVRLLTTGDMDGLYEHYAAAEADILKVAHHGSKSATGDAFLDAVSPRAALITGNGHSESHPHPQLLSRLAEREVLVYNTGECGAVTLLCHQGEARIQTFLPFPEP